MLGTEDTTAVNRRCANAWRALNVELGLPDADQNPEDFIALVREGIEARLTRGDSDENSLQRVEGFAEEFNEMVSTAIHSTLMSIQTCKHRES